MIYDRINFSKTPSLYRVGVFYCTTNHNLTSIQGKLHSRYGVLLKERNMKNEKIGLLYRVSSKPQEDDGGGLDVQRKLGKQMSQKLGLDYIEFDEGVQSSYNTEVNQRPKLLELLNEIQKKNGLRKIWVFHPDRLGRYSNSWWSILKIFIDYRVEVYFGESPKPYDFNNSSDKFFIQILSLVSQYDNELRRLRSILGKRNSLKNGNTWIGGTIPFGYSVQGKKLVVNPDESKYVKSIFKMYDQGKSTMDIKVYLDQQSEINPRRSLKGWNVGTVLSMLKKEIYIGKQVWIWEEKLPNGEFEEVERIELKVPPIVERKLWDSVQKKIKENFPDTINGTNTSLLKGLLVCPKCQLKLGHRFKDTNHYYGKCSEHNWRKVGDKIDTKDCVLKKSPRMEELDKKIFGVILNTLRNSRKIREDYKVKNLKPKFEEEEKVRKQIEGLKRKLSGKNTELKKVEDELASVEFDLRMGKIPTRHGGLLRDKFQKHLTVLNNEIEFINSDLQSLSNSKGWINWLEKMNSELEKVENYDLDKKREFLKDVVKDISVQYNPKSKSHTFDVHFILPIVGDSLLYGNGRDKKGFKTYEIKNGRSKVNKSVEVVTTKTTSMDSKHVELTKRIQHLKEVEGKSNNEISDILNSEGLTPINGGKWYKSRLSSFYNYSKKMVPKESGVRKSIQTDHSITVE